MGRELAEALKHRVFLLDTIPSFFSGDFGVVPNLVCKVSEVGVRRNKLLTSRVFPSEGLAKNHDAAISPEGISTPEHWL